MIIAKKEIAPPARLKSALHTCASCLALMVTTGLTAPDVHAQSVTIANGQTRTAPIAMNGTGQTATIAEGGTLRLTGGTTGFTIVGTTQRFINGGLVDVSGVNAIGLMNGATNFRANNNGTMRANGRDATLIGNVANGAQFFNAGTLSVTGDDTHVFRSTGRSTSFLNTGTITQSGAGNRGLVMDGTFGTITNRGTMTFSGDQTVGMIVAANGTLRNEGTITMSGPLAMAMGAQASDVSAVNTGTLIFTSGAGQGIVIRGDAASILNTGTIDMRRADGVALGIFGNDSQITNSGTIIFREAPAGQNLGVFMQTVSAQFTNSGQIHTRGGNAVIFAMVDSDDTLTLNTGSILEGRIRLGTGRDTVNVARNMMLNYTFESAPEVVNTNGTPFALVGNRLVTVSPDALNKASRLLASEMTGGIQNTLGNRLQDNRQARKENGMGLVRSYAPTIAGTAAISDLMQAPATKRHVWGQAFGAFARYDGRQGRADTQISQGGFVIGLDKTFGNTMQAGIFGALALGQAKTTGQKTEKTIGGFAGLYADLNTWASVSLVAGHMNHDHSRRVLNNMVLGGIETAKGKGRSWLLSPELTLRLGTYKLGRVGLRPSMRARYIFQNQAGFTETGTTAPLTIKSLNAHTFEGRVQVAFDVIKNAKTRLELRTGVDVRATSAPNTTQVQVLGRTLQMAGGQDRSAWGGFIGGKLRHKISNRSAIFATSEISTMTDRKIAADLRIGFQMKF